MMEVEGLPNVLPGIKSIEEGVNVYRNFYSEQTERLFGVLAICASRPPHQPYVHVMRILSGLSYEGIGSTLGLVQTAGTCVDALPPPRSVLKSFMLPYKPNVLPYKPNVKCCTLTSGARALAKHVVRSTDGWWGSFSGNDPHKRKLAVNIIRHFILDCCWMNIHIIRTHGYLLEIRVHEGYGARWSSDGSLFIGFLEPYTEDGYSQRWKH